jgi:hypothetical protein
MTTWSMSFVVDVADGRGSVWSLVAVVVGVVTVPGSGRMQLGLTTTALPLDVVEDRCGRAVLDARRHRLVTVEADQDRVEFRLAAGRVGCPDCSGALRPWGWARPRGVHGLAGLMRPRRARCPVCLVTHVLLPVTALLRRAYAADVIGAALLARAAELGHRAIGHTLGVPAATVRGWLRVMAARLESTRLHLLQVTRRAGVDVAVPEALGCPWRDLLAALGAATAAVTGRFGGFGVLGAVTAWQVAAACSAGRLLAPGWAAPGPGRWATPVAPDARGC